MSDLPDRDDPHPDDWTWSLLVKIADAYQRGELKSRDEMNLDAALEAFALWTEYDQLVPLRTRMADVLDAAWGVADE